MEKWEYKTISLIKENQDWLSPIGPRDDIKGMDEALNYYGKIGWELVSVTPLSWTHPESTDPHVQYVRIYHAYFKRRIP